MAVHKMFVFECAHMQTCDLSDFEIGIERKNCI